MLISAFLDWFHQHGSMLRTKLGAKAEKYPCLTKSGLYDLRGEIVTKNTRLFIGRCRNIDCAAVKNSQY
jgi:hypothetical protein